MAVLPSILSKVVTLHTIDNQQCVADLILRRKELY